MKNANECFFRKLPLASMKQITLRMDGEREDSIPYATYFTTTGSKEVSTLNDVKKRLGLDTDSEDDVTPTPDPSDSADPTQAPDDSDNTADPTQAPDPDDNNNNSNNVTTEIIQVRQILRFRQQRDILADLLMICVSRLAIPVLQNMTKTG